MNIFKKRDLRPAPRIVCGIEVKKQPTLAYIKAAERTSGLVMELLDDAFPGKTPKEIIIYLTELTPEKLREVAGRLLYALPQKALAILREIVGAADNPAWDNLTPFEHSEVIKAFWELNDLSAFFMNVRSALPQTVRAGKQTDGLNG